MCRRPLTIALLLAALLCGVAHALPAVGPDESVCDEADPYCAVFEADPYTNGNSLGPMYRPKGKLARVVWLQGDGFGSELPGDPSGWERRVVQRFDEEGRCIEVEDWSMGFLEWRTTRLFGSSGQVETIVTSEGGPKGGSWRSELLRDGSGRLHAITRVALDSMGKPRPDSPPRLEREITYDNEGRVTHRVDYGERGPAHQQEWTYDAQGRVATMHWTSCAIGLTSSTSHTYDEQGRTRATTWRSSGDPDMRTEYKYDESRSHERHVRVTQAGALVWQEVSEYDVHGSLAKRETDDRRNGLRTVETFHGGDARVLARVSFGKDGLVEDTTFEYVEDERGNWVRKIAVRKGVRHNDTMRVIEYAD